MAYATGTANSFADLLTALQNACTANDWTLSGNVLHKGTCYAEVKVGDLGETGAPTGKMLWLRAGNGIDGSNNLTDPMTTGVGVGIGVLRPDYSIASYPDWDWPVTYHVHVLTAPDEVYFVVNYRGGTKWQHLYFGQSPAPGCDGTGNWAYGFVQETLDNFRTRGEDRIACSPTGMRAEWYYSVRLTAGPFWLYSRGVSSGISEGCINFQFHGAAHWTDGTGGWSSKFGAFGNGAASGSYGETRTVSASVCDSGPYSSTTGLLYRTPNAWNNETLLVPIVIASPRAEYKVSIVGRLGHARMCRNDFLEDGAIITLGPDKWKVYPCFKKDTSHRNGYPGSSTAYGDSGTVATAIRYDGP